MQINLELRTLKFRLGILTVVVVCEYFIKYSWLCPWLFKWPDYEEEYEEDGQQDSYDN